MIRYLKATPHVGAAISSHLSVDASLVAATQGAILKSLGAACTCARQRRQILKRPPRLRNVNRRRNSGPWRAHNLRFGNPHVLHRPAWRFIFRRKPWFRLSPFEPFFRNHNAVIVAQNIAGLRRRRYRQRRQQKNQHDHRKFAHDCHFAIAGIVRICLTRSFLIPRPVSPSFRSWQRG